MRENFNSRDVFLAGVCERQSFIIGLCSLLELLCVYERERASSSCCVPHWNMCACKEIESFISRDVFLAGREKKREGESFIIISRAVLLKHVRVKEKVSLVVLYYLLEYVLVCEREGELHPLCCVAGIYVYV